MAQPKVARGPHEAAITHVAEQLPARPRLPGPIVGRNVNVRIVDPLVRDAIKMAALPGEHAGQTILRLLRPVLLAEPNPEAKVPA